MGIGERHACGDTGMVLVLNFCIVFLVFSGGIVKSSKFCVGCSSLDRLITKKKTLRINVEAKSCGSVKVGFSELYHWIAAIYGRIRFVSFVIQISFHKAAMRKPDEAFRLLAQVLLPLMAICILLFLPLGAQHTRHNRTVMKRGATALVSALHS